MSEEIKEYKLSDQAVASLMMTVQKAFAEVAQGREADVGEMLKEWKLTLHGSEVVVLNPPVVQIDQEAEVAGNILDLGE